MLHRYAEMILTTEAFHREHPGGIPLNQVQKVKVEEVSRCIPGRIKNESIYNRLQAALDNDKGVEADDYEDDDPLALIAEEIFEGMSGFAADFVLSDDQMDGIMNEFLDEDQGGEGGEGMREGSVPGVEEGKTN